MKLNPQPF